MLSFTNVQACLASKDAFKVQAGTTAVRYGRSGQQHEFLLTKCQVINSQSSSSGWLHLRL